MIEDGHLSNGFRYKMVGHSHVLLILSLGPSEYSFTIRVVFDFIFFLPVGVLLFPLNSILKDTKALSLLQILLEPIDVEHSSLVVDNYASTVLFSGLIINLNLLGQVSTV